MSKKQDFTAFSEKQMKALCWWMPESPLKNYDAVISTSALHHFKKEEKMVLYKKIFECLKNNGEFINCDYIALTQEIEDEQLYELEHNMDDDKHIDIPLTVENELEILKAVGFEEVTSSNVDKESYSLIKARKIK